jgi:hypothetical protein
VLPTRRARLSVCLTSLVVLAACSAEPSADDEAAARSSAASPGLTEPVIVEREMPDASLPGDEALTPPPPDPHASPVLEQLERLPIAPLAGTVIMNVSGLVGFDEPVTGRCTADGGTRGFAMSLSDGSELTVEFGSDGGVSRLTAPGIEVTQTLADIDVRVSDGGVQVSAGLVTAGTSEPSGRLSLEGRCA